MALPQSLRDFFTLNFGGGEANYLVVFLELKKKQPHDSKKQSHDSRNGW